MCGLLAKMMTMYSVVLEPPLLFVPVLRSASPPSLLAVVVCTTLLACCT